MTCRRMGVAIANDQPDIIHLTVQKRECEADGKFFKLLVAGTAPDVAYQAYCCDSYDDEPTPPSDDAWRPYSPPPGPPGPGATPPGPTPRPAPPVPMPPQAPAGLSVSQLFDRIWEVIRRIWRSFRRLWRWP